MNDQINVIGIDLGELVAALHNGTKSIGFGVAQDLRRDMTADEARMHLRSGEGYLRNGQVSFDYFYGRPVKVRIDTATGTLYNASLYDRDAPDGDDACQKAVDLARSRSPGDVQVESVDQKQISDS
jgi:hypothetical protein